MHPSHPDDSPRDPASPVPPPPSTLPQDPPLTVPGLALVAEDVARVQTRLLALAEGAEDPLPAIAAHLIGSGGKRVRPLVLLLAAEACGERGEHLIPLAAAAELLHSATLLHDDVVDEAETRRGEPVAHVLWGNPLAVLAGDYCMAAALIEIATVGDPRAVRTLAQTLQAMAEGEVIQLRSRDRLELSEERYRDVVRRKTASLMSWCARVGGLLPPEQDAALQEFGDAMGMAFQIADDILDYQGDAQVTGKDIGTDLREGKPTLPLIEACRRLPDLEPRLRALGANGGRSDEALADVVAQVRASGAIEATREQAFAEATRAREALARIPAGPHRDALAELALFTADRIA